MGREAEISKILSELHASYLKSNEHDEGDLLYYRINNRLVDTFAITSEEAEKMHSDYHKENPRQVSQGHCEKCNRVVTIIPIIYGIQASDLERLKLAETRGKLVIGDIDKIKEGSKLAMFACGECKNPLPKYGTI